MEVFNDNELKSDIHDDKEGNNNDVLKMFSSNIPRLNVNDFDKSMLIGQGGVSKVYKIVNKQTHEEFAAKILSRQSSNFLKLFCNGANINSEINHPSIVKIFGCTSFSIENKMRPSIIIEYFLKMAH